MISVDKIQDIRQMWRCGRSVAEIARITGISEPTVRKYRDMDDLSPKPPRRHKEKSSLLAPYVATIDSWLLDDKKYWRKQRHTAVRVYVRLKEEKGYKGSYSTVQRYVRRRREKMAREADQRDQQGFLQLEWVVGECQVDFGQADFRVRGTLTRGHYLTLSFPHSNVGFTQLFWGETSECVCEGLANIFEFIGGVPLRAIFDNATEVGRKICGKVHTSRLFRMFAAHYGLSYNFTNPYSGNEKGNVEAKVGHHRRNLFVPIPQFHDVKAFNLRLLHDCLDLSDKTHYRLGIPELDLFEQDKSALLMLPASRFDCVCWKVRKCNKQGVFTLGGIHRYSAGPAYAKQAVNVALGAFDVTVVDQKTAEIIVVYEREWSDIPTDSADPMLQLKLLCLRPSGWRDSIVRDSLPAELVSYLDRQPVADLRQSLRILRDEAGSYGFVCAVEAMALSLEATGDVDSATVGLTAARIASGNPHVDYDEKVDLDAYDQAFRLVKGDGLDAA